MSNAYFLTNEQILAMQSGIPRLLWLYDRGNTCVEALIINTYRDFPDGNSTVSETLRLHGKSHWMLATQLQISGVLRATGRRRRYFDTATDSDEGAGLRIFRAWSPAWEALPLAQIQIRMVEVCGGLHEYLDLMNEHAVNRRAGFPLPTADIELEVILAMWGLRPRATAGDMQGASFTLGRQLPPPVPSAPVEESEEEYEDSSSAESSSTEPTSPSDE